jgi:hypothetical protein
MLEVIVNGQDESTNISVKKAIEKALYNEIANLSQETDAESSKENPDAIVISRNGDKIAQLVAIKNSLVTRNQKIMDQALKETVAKMDSVYGKDGW